MIKILLSIYLLLSSFVLFAQGLFENDPIWRDEFNRDMFLVLCIGVI